MDHEYPDVSVLYADEDEWEPSVEHTAALIVSEIVGTPMHIEVDRDASGEIVSLPMDVSELARLYDDERFDFLA